MIQLCPTLPFIPFLSAELCFCILLWVHTYYIELIDSLGGKGEINRGDDAEIERDVKWDNE